MVAFGLDLKQKKSTKTKRTEQAQNERKGHPGIYKLFQFSHLGHNDRFTIMKRSFSKKSTINL